MSSKTDDTPPEERPPPAEGPEVDVQSRHPGDPSTIGEYRILGRLGVGGMGLVYEAEQKKPRRRVALKVIRGGAAVGQGQVRRFEREAEILARLKHPGIAGVYEADRTTDGQHFFAMELIRGPTLDEYLESLPLERGRVWESVTARIRLFTQICDAVNYAHQRGVIHRDLKPSNILVTSKAPHGAASGPSGIAPVIKILDFGIARIYESDTMATQEGVIHGTLAYMSPEQIRGNPDEIDTRSDVYSLGVILYELLTERRPYEIGPTPVTAFAAITEHAPTSPRKIWKEKGWKLSSDLETILLKTLAKDPTQRYQSAWSLAEDLTRHLSGAPIMARPPSTPYQLRRLIARHKVGSVAAAALVVSLATFAISMNIGRNRALSAESLASQEAAKSAATLDFITGVLSSANPWLQGRDVRVADVLDQAARVVETSFYEQPEVEADIRRTLGMTYKGLGLYAEASVHLERSVAIGEATSGPDSLELADALDNLGELRAQTGDFPAADILHVRALSIREIAPDRSDAAISRTLTNLAIVAQNGGDFDTAERWLRQALDLRRGVFGDDHLAVAESLNNLASLIYRRGEFRDAEALFREALETQQRVLKEETLDIAGTMNNLAMTLNTLERFDEAEPFYRQALEIRRERFGDDHPGVAQSINNLGMFFYRRGDLTQAEQLFRDALSINRRFFGDVHPDVTSNLNNIALVLRDLGDYAAAEPLFRQVVALHRQLQGEDNPLVAAGLNNLAALLMRAGRLGEAELVFGESRGLLLRTFPEGHWRVATAESLLGECLTRMGRYGEAEELVVPAYSVIRASFAASHGRTRTALRRVIQLYEALGNEEKVTEYRAHEAT